MTPCTASAGWEGRNHIPMCRPSLRSRARNDANIAAAKPNAIQTTTFSTPSVASGESAEARIAEKSGCGCDHLRETPAVAMSNNLGKIATAMQATASMPIGAVIQCEVRSRVPRRRCGRCPRATPTIRTKQARTIPPVIATPPTVSSSAMRLKPWWANPPAAVPCRSTIR